MTDFIKHLSSILSVILYRFEVFTTTSESWESELSKVYESLNRTFLNALTGQRSEFLEFYNQYSDSPDYATIARFYKEGLNLISRELETVIIDDPEFEQKLQNVSNWFINHGKDVQLSQLAEKSWALFFPEAMGILQNEKKSINELRKKRSVRITKLNETPIKSVLKELVFTSNVLVTIPSKDKRVEQMGFSPYVQSVLSETANEEQLYWYDHPIPFGVEPDKNEVLYGMQALNEAVAYEKNHRNSPRDQKLDCILSASVTHEKLHQIVKLYLEDEFQKGETLDNLNIFLFTENETDSLIKEVLVPAAEKYLDMDPDLATEMFQVVGVDGEYGRHYSFLKAIVAFWQVFIDPEIKATFKIDLDQVFPQHELVNETGLSAFEHFYTPLWGAKGVNADNHPIDLGMIAGALVNERDFHVSLFTADVPIPNKVKSAEDLIFFSELPQAISTQAEMLTRYNSKELDGKHACIQRVHVTGGTNGILTKSLFKYRPFTPSFFGRAEDQAYIMSVLNREGMNLSYVHKDGLVMRHDKEAFAKEAIEAAYIGKLVGDYTRILYFSAYSDLISGENSQLKKWLDPFTGCFISKIPVTVVYLRFALKAMNFFHEGKKDESVQFIKNGAKRISEALNFISEDLVATYQKERFGWELYYNVLEACQIAIDSNDEYIVSLKKHAQKMIDKFQLSI